MNHNIEWSVKGSFAFQSRCSCGNWTSQVETMQYEAVQAFDRHLQEVGGMRIAEYDFLDETHGLVFEVLCPPRVFYVFHHANETFSVTDFAGNPCNPPNKQEMIDFTLQYVKDNNLLN